MEGLALLGATDAALSDQYITLRVKNIDRDKLKRKLGGGLGATATSALAFVDVSPKAALDAALPIVASKAREYGVDAEVTVANAPLAKKRAFSEFWPGLAFGLVLGGGSLGIVKLIGRLVRR